ncbi:hypothetical protein [Pseudomonas sp. S1(2024)]|uniref:hypothetical protein n=1 Tax=Pseudomonas sp. S1(2024) TaxID=3390191 RepID=UPI00397D7172
MTAQAQCPLGGSSKKWVVFAPRIEQGNTTVVTNEAPPQPDVRSGEVIAAEGRWNEAALRRIRQQAGAHLTWTKGTLGYSISMNGIVIGRLNRRPRGQPWTASIQGFERWHEPTRIIKHWHYTPVWAANNLKEAKRQVAKVIQAIPDLGTER